MTSDQLTTAIGPPAGEDVRAGLDRLRTRPMILGGWGRLRPVPTLVCRPERTAQWLDLLDRGASTTLIPRGLGRSYGDSAVDDRGLTVVCTRLNRLVDFDREAGSVTCEAGTSLGELIRTFLPRGYFLPVSPRTKHVSVCGAIAAAVHGKNRHEDGTFGNFVEGFELLTAGGEVVTYTAQKHPDWFRATIGGMGLTGAILRARIRLRPVETSRLRVDYHKAPDLDRALSLFQEGDRRYQYSVAWIDCLARGRSLGRAVLMRGNHASRDDLPAALRSVPLAVARPHQRTIPFDLPGFTLNPLTVGAFNAMYYRMHRDRDGALVDYEPFFYPLDGLDRWNRIYGRRGFAQYQALFPTESSHRGMIALLEEIARSRIGSFLAVLKSTGAAGEGLLSFPRAGHTLALDLPNGGRRLVQLAERLDRIVLDHGGRLYLAKDSLTSASTFAAMYAEGLGPFRAVKRSVDPAGRFASAQARRLGLVEDRR